MTQFEQDMALVRDGDLAAIKEMLARRRFEITELDERMEECRNKYGLTILDFQFQQAKDELGAIESIYQTRFA